MFSSASLVQNNRSKSFKVIHLPFFTPMQTFSLKVHTRPVSGLVWILLFFLRHSKETKHHHFPLSTSTYLLHPLAAEDSPAPLGRHPLRSKINYKCKRTTLSPRRVLKERKAARRNSRLSTPSTRHSSGNSSCRLIVLILFILTLSPPPTAWTYQQRWTKRQHTINK